MSRLKPRLAVFVLAVAVGVPLSGTPAAETGAFVFQQYGPKIYGSNPQCWAAAQDARGVMYFANTDGVLEFDGLFWRTIPVTNNLAVRSLAADARGRVYVGSQGVFGYLASDERGASRFVPLRVPETDANFGNVLDVVPTPNGVYFGTNTAIYLLNNSSEIKVIRARDKFGNIFAASNELFVTTTDRGLQRLEGDHLVAGPRGGEMLRGAVLFADGDQPLVAGESSLFRFSVSDIQPLFGGSAPYLKAHGIWTVKQLPGGQIAVGTSNGGLVLLDQGGDVERIIRQQDGLPSDRVTFIYRDRQQGIWLTTDNGIVRYSPALSSFGEKQGLHAGVISLARFGGVMYAGTKRGLFRMRTVAGSAPVFQPVGDIHEYIWTLVEQAGDALVGGDHALFRLRGDTLEKLAPTAAIYDIGVSRRDRSLIYTAGADGIIIWKHEGQTWRVAGQASANGQELRTVVEAADGRLWATSRSAIWRFDFSVSPTKVEQFASSSGVPSNWVNTYWFLGHPVFATSKGLRRFNEREYRFEPDLELGPQYSDGSKAVSLLREDQYGKVWITGTGYHDLLQKDRNAEYRAFAFPMLAANLKEMWALFNDADGACWASGESGELFRLERLGASSTSSPAPVLLREVTVIGQSAPLYEGDAEQPRYLALQYHDNALRFEFAAPFLEDPSSVRYQFRLDNEKNWSAWSSESRKDYTNLFEGSYQFRVRARDGHGRETAEAVYAFHIAPPPYRTWWAYALYASALFSLGWGVLRWRTKALQEKNRRLESVVAERTAEVRAERDQNEALLLNILPRPVAAELRTNKSVKPTNFDDVTVCFSDFVGFTLSSEKMAADKLITSLNEYFTEFDEIIGRYELEKLKTIGDAYMFAGGLPTARPSHAVDAVLAALEMAAVVSRLTQPEEGVNWKIRLGLNSGPVVAGVVGVRKFAFDIWGSTVNFAARMEAAGAPGRVNISDVTYQRVNRFVECESRGAVPIKEGRRVEMYYALGPKTELLLGPSQNGVPEAFSVAYQQAFGAPPRSFPSQAVLEELQKQPLMTGEVK